MKHLSRFLLWAGAALTPFVIACAYGTPYRYSRNGRILDKETGQGIPGIQVSCLRADGSSHSSGFSVEDGTFVLEYDEPCASVEAKDVDGDGNGRYRTSTIEFGEGELVVPMDRE